MSYPEAVRRGLDLALDAHRRGLVDEPALNLILTYYDQEGARAPAPPEEVLERLGGLTVAQLAALGVRRPPTPTGGARGARLSEEGRAFNDRLELLDVLGEGGMGSVYRAYDRVLRRVVAVKLIRADRLGTQDRQRHLARFEREAQVMARLRHPACVAIFDAGLSPQGHPYLSMEYVAGRTLGDLIAEAAGSGQPLEVQAVARWGRAIAEGLQACHEAGVVHRDVKPANVLIDGVGQSRLTDFGIARDDQAHTKLTGELVAVGTLLYLPPEQAAGGGVDARSDVYALGATLYEALTGRTVFEGELALVILQQIAAARPEPPTRHRPELPLDLERVVLKCLEKDPADRYPSARELALDLSRFLAGEPVAARPLTAGQHVLRALKRRRRALSAGGLALLGLSALAGSAWALEARRLRRAGLAEVALADRSPGLDAAEARLQAWRAGRDEVVAAGAEAALLRLRGRRRLAEADASLARYAIARDRLAAQAQELERVEATIRALPPLIPVAEAPPKQRRLRLLDAREALERSAERELSLVEQLLAQAAIDLPEALLAATRAQLCLARGRALELDDPEQAEVWLAQGAAADRLAGGVVGAALRPGVVELRSTPPGALTVSRYTFDPRVGHQVPTVVLESQTPTRLELPTGDYVIEVRAPAHLEARRPVRIRRGSARRLELVLPPLAELGPVAQEVALLSEGTGLLFRGDRWTPRPTQRVLLARTETRFEQWHSYLVASQLVPERLPVEPGGDEVSRALLRRYPSYPIYGISTNDMQGFLDWLNAELALLGLQKMRARVPTISGLAWACRGEFTWTFPWGQRADPSFANSVPGYRNATRSRPADCSPVGVFDLAGGEREFANDDTNGLGGLTLCIFGPSAFDQVGARRAWLGETTPAEPTDPYPRTGFRIAFSLDTPTLDDDTDPATKLHFTEVLRAHPTDPRAWYQRGLTRLRAGDRWGPLWDWWKALQLDPDYLDARFSRGKLYLMRGDYDPDAWVLARIDFERVLELDPEHAGALSGRGQARWKLGDAAGGLQDLQEFLSRLPPLHPDRAKSQPLIDQMRAALARDAGAARGE